MKLDFSLHNAQLEIFKDPARFKVVAAGRRFGKNLEVSTPVLTVDGYKPIKDIVVGDIVFGRNGEQVCVQEVTEPFIDECYELTFDSGEKIVAGKNHEWVVEKVDRNLSNRTEETEVWTTEEIYKYAEHQKSLKKSAHLSVPLQGAVDTEEKNFSIHPYILGAWLGDGTSSQGNICTEDQELLDKFDSLGYKTKKYKSPKFRYGVENLTKPLRLEGLINNKHIPEKYFLGSIEQRLELLKGLLDTDGTITPAGRVQFSNTNSNLIEGVIRLCASLGIKCVKTYCTSHRSRNRISTATSEEYVCNSIEHTLTFTPVVPVFSLTRKVVKTRSTNQFGRHFIKSVVKVGSRLTKCIQVEGGLFQCSETNIITHNSYLSAIQLLIEGLKNENDDGTPLVDKRVFYVAPTFDQGKRIIWDLLKELGKEVIESTLENQAVIKLINGRKIEIKGADRPDTLRGVGLSYVVMDEYAFMKPEVWEQIIRPTLADVKGAALFIGTPDGKNHFFDLYTQAEKAEDWAIFSYNSMDNPTLDKDEIEQARKTMSESNFRQEFEASFSASGGAVFKEEYFQYMTDEPTEGTWYIAVDPAGFADLETTTQGKLNRLDECAIACVKVGSYGWYVGDIFHGRWGIRETSTRILRAAQKYKALKVGIEKGSLKNAIMPYLSDEMMRLNLFPRIDEVSHGGQKKTERIAWSLEGRFQHSKIYFREDAEWIRDLETQLLDFPNPLAHDDLVDALAYIDQVAVTDYEPEQEEDDEWVDLDFDIGRSLATGY